MIRLTAHPNGPRVYIVGRRLHHGPAFGAAAVVCYAAKLRILAAALAGIAATDWKDFPFRDCDNH